MYPIDNKISVENRQVENDSKRVKIEVTAELPYDESQLRRLFSFVITGTSQDIKTLTLVCKTWKELVSGNEFYRELYSRIANQIFGRQKWIKHFGDPGEEPRIPLSWLVQFNRSNGFLTLVPETVKIAQADGTVVEELLTAESMGKWAHSPKEGHKIESIGGYTTNSWMEAITEKRPTEKTHWVWLSKEVIGRRKIYEDQQKDAKAWGQGWDVSGLVDIVVTLFAAHVENGERYFECDPANNKYTFLRFEENFFVDKEQFIVYRPCVGILPNGLRVFDYYALAADSVGVVAARKSIGTRLLSLEMLNGSD